VARLRNRMVKAEFWTDAELLRWPRDKRFTYQGLWALAEDSGCLEDDPFGWKLLLWPSPVDVDITVESLTTWRDELVTARKAIPYEADGKHYLYLTRFHHHEKPRNPQSPNLPLPAWVSWEQNADDPRKGKYVETTTVVQALNNDATTLPALPSPARPGPVLSSPDLTISPRGDGFAPQEKEKAQKVVPVGSPEEDTAQNVVAFAVKRSRELGVDLTTRQTGHLASEVKKQFKAGADPTLIRAAVGVLIDENKSPDTLGYVMRDLKKGGTGERTGTHGGRSQDGEWV
jgi:hypothetical protein